MAEGPISGVAVGIARGARIVHSAGYGYADLENRLPVTPETIFRVGSITKQFTAAAVLQLVEEGSLELDDKLTEFLPDYPGFGPEVTVRSLLNHTSGIKNYTTMPQWWQTLAVEMSPTRLVSVFRDQPFDFRPGGNFSYSNSGYVLLGVIAEQVTDQPLGGILNERLFVPLGLLSTGYCDDRMLVRNRARGYQAVDGGFSNAAHVSMSQAYAAGAVCSNTLELIRWTRSLVRGEAVSDESFEMMRSPGVLADGTQVEYGYGIAVSYLEGHHRMTHIGGMLGFTGQLSHYDEDDLTIVVLTNTEEARAAELESDLARLMLGLGDQELRDIPLSPDELAQYTGTYDLSLTLVEVSAPGGRLTADVSIPGVEGHYEFLYQGDNNFVAAADSEISVTFETEEESVTGFVLLHKGITMRGRRVE